MSRTLTALTPKPMSVYLSRETSEVLARRTQASSSLSQTITAMTWRYEQIVKLSLPALSTAEWLLVRDALHVTRDRSHPASDPYTTVLLGVGRAVEAKIHERYKGKVDVESFRARVGKFSAIEAIAVLDMVEQLRAAADRGENPTLPGEEDRAGKGQRGKRG